MGLLLVQSKYHLLQEVSLHVKLPMVWFDPLCEVDPDKDNIIVSEDYSQQQLFSGTELTRMIALPDQFDHCVCRAIFPSNS